jgi:hypothetical protein
MSIDSDAIQIELLEGERIRDYFIRVVTETGSLNISHKYMSECGYFHEVKTKRHNLAMEEWLVEHTEANEYYCTNIYGGPASWFFNDETTAVLFGVMFADT